MTKKKFKFQPIGLNHTPSNPAGSGRHFFASSVAEWRCDDDVEALIAFMRKAGYPFTLWSVPTPASANYEIKSYCPQVKGAVLLGRYDYNEEA